MDGVNTGVDCKRKVVQIIVVNAIHYISIKAVYKLALYVNIVNCRLVSLSSSDATKSWTFQVRPDIIWLYATSENERVSNKIVCKDLPVCI